MVLGQILVTTEEDFPRLTADEVYNWWEEHVAINSDGFDRVVAACMK